MPAVPPSDKPTNSNPDRLRTFAKYSGLGFQMLVIIGLSAWAGTALDERFQNERPWYTIVFMLLGVFIAMYQVIRSLTRDS
ncbi:AtpZ/AtpI family protein [Hymenobacter sp. BT188]|uniref:AtpZ/AtpI family protein n=1 Tax=Hymenobacter sp. BT188 TaxID=2763504 RepID=UPI001650F9CE|nr:AtpZ/AtpI family protein [Hymenobacter sp. BT188]MBC6608606.1 AtpZ/AtpI family protein [Hymenobacter sp. BT188]